MSSFSFSNSLKLCRFQLKINRRTIIGWSIAMFSIMFLYMILFPSVQDMAQIKMDSMPKELLEFMGMSSFSDMSEFTSYFGIIFNILLIAISIFSVTFSAGLIVKDEKSKTIEFLSSIQVSRSEIYVSKLLTSIIAVFVVVCSAIISTLICGFANGGDTFSAKNILESVMVCAFTPFFFMSVALCLSGVSAKIGAPATGSIVVIFSYVFGYLGNLLADKAEWLKYLSPFEILKAGIIFPLDDTTVYTYIAYIVVALALCTLGCLVYRKRDFAV